MRKVILLGASGSIGKQTLDIIEDHRSEIEVVALSVGHNIDFLRSYLKDHDILCAYAIKVPEDIGVTGFDDTPLAAKLNPPLTTMQVQKESMGKEAVHRLVDRIQRKDYIQKTELLSVQLIERSSVQ